jgi:hypothetical protein
MHNTPHTSLCDDITERLFDKAKRKFDMSDKKKLKPGDTVNLPPIKIKENPMVKKMEEADSEVLAEALRDLLRKNNEK